MEAWGGTSLSCCCHTGDWLWCCHTPLLLHLLWGCELLIRESPLSHLATCSLLLPTKGDLAQVEEWAHKCLFPLDRGWAVTIAPQCPALTRCWLSSSCKSAMNWSCHLWGEMLGANRHCPWYTCSTTSNISWSVDPRKVLTEECSWAVSLDMAVCCKWEHLCMYHSQSIICIAPTLWKRESPHSCWWMVFPLGCSLLSSSRKS